VAVPFDHTLTDSEDGPSHLVAMLRYMPPQRLKQAPRAEVAPGAVNRIWPLRYSPLFWSLRSAKRPQTVKCAQGGNPEQATQAFRGEALSWIPPAVLRGSLGACLPSPLCAIWRQAIRTPGKARAALLRALPEPARPTRGGLQGQWAAAVRGALALRRGPAPAAAPASEPTPSHKCCGSLRRESAQTLPGLNSEGNALA